MCVCVFVYVYVLQVIESEDTIVLDNVPIVTPNRDVVASGLTFRVSENSVVSHHVTRFEKCVPSILKPFIPPPLTHTHTHTHTHTEGNSRYALVNHWTKRVWKELFI